MQRRGRAGEVEGKLEAKASEKRSRPKSGIDSECERVCAECGGTREIAHAMSRTKN